MPDPTTLPESPPATDPNPLTVLGELGLCPDDFTHLPLPASAAPDGLSASPAAGVSISPATGGPVPPPGGLSSTDRHLLYHLFFLGGLGLPATAGDQQWIDLAIRLIAAIDECSALGTRWVDLFDFVSHLEAQGFEISFYYGLTTKQIKGISFATPEFRCAGYQLGGRLSFPKMRRTFLTYDPQRHTPVALPSCRHINAFPACPIYPV